MRDYILKEIFLKYQPAFFPVVEFHPQTDSLLLLDFTSANKTLTADLLENTEKYSNYIDDQLKAAGAVYGIGGYGENRTVYSRSKVFDAAVEGDEPRRLHLGTDIWGKPHTAIRAPLDGIVHSFAFNNNFGDYGATIILAHQLDGKVFYTLYGHLSLNNLKNLEEGQTIRKGETFAEFGIPFENGHWPPHLHFQIIIDLENYKGDYPGVCKLSEKEKYFSNCPDPDLVLQMNKYLK